MPKIFFLDLLISKINDFGVYACKWLSAKLQASKVQDLRMKAAANPLKGNLISTVLSALHLAESFHTNEIILK